MKKLFLFFLVLNMATLLPAQKKDTKPAVTEPKKDDLPLAGIKFRNIGPAVTSGRISDFAVNPNNFNEYYVASSSGGVWKTVNAGTTYEPIFDGQGSYSMGCIKSLEGKLEAAGAPYTPGRIPEYKKN